MQKMNFCFTSHTNKKINNHRIKA